MKKLQTLMVLSVAALILGGCGGNGSSSSDSGSSDSTSASTDSSSSSVNNISDSSAIASDAFPSEVVSAFESLNSMTAVVEAPVSSYTWAYQHCIDTYGVYLWIYTMDKGTIGTNSIEDTYKATLSAAGSKWTIDSSDYTNSGYFASYEGDDNTLLQFFTYDGYFQLTLYAVNADAGSATASTDSGSSSSDSSSSSSSSASSSSSSTSSVVTVPNSVDVSGKTFSVASSIAVGNIVAVAAPSAKMELSGFSNATGGYATGVAYTSVPAGAFAFEVVAGSAAGSFAFKNGSNYVSWATGSKNKLEVSSAVDANSSWTVAFDASNNATILNVSDTSRQILWNVGAPRFATYSGQTVGSAYYAVQLFVASVA